MTEPILSLKAGCRNQNEKGNVKILNSKRYGYGKFERCTRAAGHVKHGTEGDKMQIVERAAERLIEARDRHLDEKFMKAAMKEAQKAYEIGDVPIGCVIVSNGKVIARGYNRRNADKSVLAHAELVAIQKACKKTKDWRLEDCTMYVTLEPCQMCAGAIVQARIPRVVIGSMNPKAGCAGSILNLLTMAEFNHQCELLTGILAEESSTLLKRFFAELREKDESKE